MPIEGRFSARRAAGGGAAQLTVGAPAWFTIAMIRIAIFVALLLVALVYAFRKGGGPERAMATILLAMAAADQLWHLFVPARFLTVDTGHLAIDLAGAAATLVLALVAYRFWPMVAATLQMLPLLAHFGRAVDISVDPAAYLTMQVAASWLLPPLLILATWRHQRRMRKNGSDRSWYVSWHRSNPPPASD